jgi:ADP-heptose:LPS heptosyltransferase
MTRPARVLVIRFSSIGDIVLTTPVLRALKKQLDGGAEVHYLTKEKFAGLLEGNPNVDKVHTIKESVQEVLPELERLEYDYLIDLHNNIRSRIVRRKLNVLSFTFHKLNFRKWLWVNLGINRMPSAHVVDRYMETLAAFSVSDDQQGLDFFIPEGDRIASNDLPSTHRSGYVALAIGGAHIGKKMDALKLEELCLSIPYPLILLGGTEDAETGAQIAARLGERVLNKAGVCSIHQSADLLRQSRVVVAGDTGLMHIAAAFGKKIVSVWGCTVPGLGMAPWRPHPDSVVIEPEGRSRRPCSKLGNQCKYGLDNRCIQTIENARIVAVVAQLWGIR